MKNLENYGVQELNAREVVSVEGGLKIPVKKIVKFGRWFMEVTGIYDAIEDFQAGWQEGASEYDCC